MTTDKKLIRKIKNFNKNREFVAIRILVSTNKYTIFKGNPLNELDEQYVGEYRSLQKAFNIAKPIARRLNGRIVFV